MAQADLMTAQQVSTTTANNNKTHHLSTAGHLLPAKVDATPAASGLAGERYRRKESRGQPSASSSVVDTATRSSNPNGSGRFLSAGSSEALSTVEHWPAPSLAASFSFNSYQDIICSGFASSSFAAADVRRTLADSNNAAAAEALKEPDHEKQQSEQKKLGRLAKFRVHSRHISVGGRFTEWLLAAPKESNTSVGSQTRREQQEHSRPAEATATTRPGEQKPAAITTTTTTSKESNEDNSNRLRIVNSNPNPKTAINETGVFPSTSLDCIVAADERKKQQQNLKEEQNNSGKLRPNKYASKQQQKQQQQQPVISNQREIRETKNMSQTLQSLQSLSLQLNRAASLRSSSQGEMSSALSSIAGHSPSSGAGFANTDAGDCVLLPVGGFGANNNAGNSGTNSGASASSQANKFSRLVGKKATRVKELLLQNLGKADRTTDELFEIHEENFYRQQNQAIKLQKEFKSYLNSLKGTQEANKSLNCCIQQSTGDYQSARHDLVCENLSQLEHLNEDLMEKLRQQIAASISEYLAQFGELRDKISKRRRKLIDYDSSRRVYEATLASVNRKRQLQQLQQQQQQLAVAAEQAAATSGGFSSSASIQPGGGGSASESIFQSATSQLINEARLLKLREQHNYCKLMYETINSELHEELPMVYEKKMKHLLMTLQNYFSLEAQFHSNASKLFATASDFIDELPMSYQQQQNGGLNSSHCQLVPVKDDGEIGGSDCANEQGAVEGATSVDEYDSPANRLIGKPDGGGTASGSSGVGSSRGGDSSLESSSSPDASSSGSPTNEEENDDHETRCQTELDDDEIEQAEGDEDETCGVVAVCCNGDQVDEEENANESEDGDMSPSTANIDEKEPLEAGKGAVGVAAGSQGAQSESESVDRAGGNVVVIGDNGAKSDEPVKSSSGQSEGLVKVAAVPEEQQSAAAAVVKKAAVASKAEEIVTSAVAEAIAHQQLPNAIVGQKEKSSQGMSDQGERSKIVVAAGKQPTNGKSADSEDVTCLYKVKTSYKYLAEDVDELCFEADEVIQVVEFDENQEQEEGWLMGVREVNGQRGLFPANFTRPI